MSGPSFYSYSYASDVLYEHISEYYTHGISNKLGGYFYESGQVDYRRDVTGFYNDDSEFFRGSYYNSLDGGYGYSGYLRRSGYDFTIGYSGHYNGHYDYFSRQYVNSSAGTYRLYEGYITDDIRKGFEASYNAYTGSYFLNYELGDLSSSDYEPYYSRHASYSPASGYTVYNNYQLLSYQY